MELDHVDRSVVSVERGLGEVPRLSLTGEAKDIQLHFFDVHQGDVALAKIRPESNDGVVDESNLNGRLRELNVVSYIQPTGTMVWLSLQIKVEGTVDASKLDVRTAASSKGLADQGVANIEKDVVTARNSSTNDNIARCVVVTEDSHLGWILELSVEGAGELIDHGFPEQGEAHGRS